MFQKGLQYGYFVQCICDMVLDIAVLSYSCMRPISGVVRSGIRKNGSVTGTDSKFVLDNQW
jgi:hypothetical protein